MGFWDSAGKLAKEVAKDALDSAREIRAIHDRLESRSSAELRKIITDNGIFSSATERKSAWHARFCVTGANSDYAAGSVQALSVVHVQV